MMTAIAILGLPWLTRASEAARICMGGDDIVPGDMICGCKHLTSLGTRFGDCDYFGVVRVAEHKVGEGLE